MLQTMQEGKGSVGKVVMLDSAKAKWVGGERRDVRDIARVKGLVGKYVMLQTVQPGKGSFGRDPMLHCKVEKGCSGETM